MTNSKRTHLDQKLLRKIAEKKAKSEKYVREQISKRASRLGVTSEVVQILWAKQLGIGTAIPLRKLEPHMQDQFRAALPTVFAAPSYPRARGEKKAKPRRQANSISLAIDYLLSDEELKARCKDLLKKRRHFDRVFREAITVLENRIRSRGGIQERLNPEPLVSKVLNPDPTKAILLISSDRSEQAGFHSICRGIVLAFRHPAHHQLNDKVTRGDALKLCAFIDVLLDILGKAQKQSPTSSSTD